MENSFRVEVISLGDGELIHIIRDRDDSPWLVAGEIARLAGFGSARSAVLRRIPSQRRLVVGGSEAILATGDRMARRVNLCRAGALDGLLDSPSLMWSPRRRWLRDTLHRIENGAPVPPGLPSPITDRGNGLFGTGELAEMFALSAKALNKVLHDHGIQYPIRRRGRMFWLPTDAFRRRYPGAATVRTVAKGGLALLWSSEGLDEIGKLLRSVGIPPVGDHGEAGE